MSRNKWKTIDLSLQFSTKTDWSQEEVDAPLSDINSIRSSLPTKTNATRQTAELDNISENGPFILNFANIPFESTESDLQQFFRGFAICDIELNVPRRGCGRIAFTNLNDLAGAWKMNEKIFLSRPIRLSIPLKDDLAKQQPMGSKPKYQSQQNSLMSDDCDNWRVKKPQTIQQESSPHSREGEQSNWRSNTANDSDLHPSDQSNWRSNRVNVQSTETKLSDNSAWRTQAPVEPKAESSAWRTQAPVEPKVESSAWRTQAARTTEKPKTSDADDSANWRTRNLLAEGQKNVATADEAAVSGDGNWRRGGSGESSTVTVAKEERRSSGTQDDSGDLKKRSVFGEARPVDTTAKDKEIEAKLEHTKLTVDLPKSDKASKLNAWGPKKTQTVPINNTTNVDKSNIPEWRIKQNPPSVSRSNLMNENQKESNNTKESEVEKLPKKPLLAPPPAVNVWAERLKSKANTGVATAKGTSGTDKVEKPVVEEKVISKEVPNGEETATSTNTTTSSSNNNNTNINDDGQSGKSCKNAQAQDTKVMSRIPVVISVNGPYLDPKSHRTPPPHPVSDNSKSPTAIPITKAPGFVATVGPVTPTAKPLNYDMQIISNQSSWSRGPPKGLIEKQGSGTVHNPSANR